jgi:ubiquinone/menaquinone biosynthesis C-methylase UbiE
MLKKIFKKICPPLFIDFFLFIKSLYNNQKYYINKNPINQSLAVYSSSKMANDLEIWGEKSTWIEIQYLLHGKKNKFLDVACGTGVVMEILSKNNHNNVYGCDISEYLIQKAIKRGIRKENLLVCNAEQLPYEDNFFDYCYSIGSLEHFTEEGLKNFFKSASRVTKYEGFHMIPVSKSGLDEGWIYDKVSRQSFFNNSISWWKEKLRNFYKKTTVIQSTWRSDISDGIWLITSK